METIRFVCLRWRVAVPLMSNYVHNNRRIEIPGSGQSEFQFSFVVPVNRADVLQAQILKHSLWCHHVFDALFHAMKRVENWGSDHWGSK